MGGQVPQTVVADTPPKADEPRTTDAGSQGKDLMSFLDIPAEVQGQLKPREAPTELPGDVPPPTETPEQPPHQEVELPKEEAADEEPEEEEEEPAAQQQEEPPKVDKRQKRINRLTRQKSELAAKLDAAAAEREELRKKLEQFEGKQQQPIVPTGIGRLGWISSEQQLAQEYAKAQGVMDWCDQNPQGATVGEGENEKYYDPETIAGWRREAEKLVMTAPMRREELRQYSTARNYYDGLVKQAWPELLDQTTQDYQIAEAIRQQYPVLRHLPQGDYVVGLLVEGAKSLDARNAKNGQQPPKQHRDIDERAFAPRVPLSPHTANPPTRTAAPSSKQRLNEAMDNLIKDPDGSETSVAAAFGALDAARPHQRPTAKTPVTS
jgi:hypothetical protein